MLLTADRRMQYQQTLSSFAIGVVVVVTPRLQVALFESVLESLRSAINGVAAGEIIHIRITS